MGVGGGNGYGWFCIYLFIFIVGDFLGQFNVLYIYIYIYIYIILMCCMEEQNIQENCKMVCKNR